MSHLRVGHAFPTHDYITTKNESPICELFGVGITVKHIITECWKYEGMRKNTKYLTRMDQYSDKTKYNWIKKKKKIIMNILKELHNIYV